MSMPLVGVVGGYGAVGAAAARELGGGAALRIGGRDAVRAEAAAGTLGDRAEWTVVDATDPASLAAFAAGCAVVVNCAGPAATIGAAVAEAAHAAGVDYVDAAGDDELHAAVAALGPRPGWRAVISAGMLPGLTGVLPRLVAPGLTPPLRLTGWVGGRDRFTETAALDYLATAGSFGATFAGWRAGRRVPGVATARTGVDAPLFPGPVAATPYLSTEAERVAIDLGLTDATWFSVFDGDHLWQALGQGADRDPRERAAAISRAADLDLFGADPYQLVVVEIAGATGARTAAVRAAGASALTGAVAAVATRAVLAGAVPAGTHHAAEVLDPEWTVKQLAGCAAIRDVAVTEGLAADAAVVDEGVL